MNTDQLERESLEQGKRLAKFTLRLLIKLTKPYWPLIAIILLIVFMFLAIIAGVYSAFPNTDGNKNKPPIMAGVYESTEDKGLRDNYYTLCNKYNVLDTWAVNSEPIGPEDGSAYESSPEKTFYPSQGGERLGELKDSYGNDQKLKLLWGQVHAATLYNTYANNLPEITKELQDKVAKGLHPYFYYKKSKVIVTSCDENGCETTVSTQYLLVEANTIQGHYQYHYKWETKTTSSGKSSTTVTREVLKDVQQIFPNRWQRLEDWMKQEYKINDNTKDLEVARTAVWEASSGFNEQTEWLEWLTQNNRSGRYLSQSSIPPELIPLFKEAEAKFSVPWWFLAAVAYKESSFNPMAENVGSKCYGLMQISPANWPSYARALGFDPELDKDNPRAQIFAGAYMLSELGFKNVNWKGNWKEQTLPILTHYGGFVRVPSDKPYSSPQEWCRAEYASVIWNYAEKFKEGGTRWPLPGYTFISSYFGDSEGRDHSHKGIDIPAPAGTPVLASSTGRVTYAGWENPSNHKQGFGLYVTIRDENYLYFYGHLSSINVKIGQDVNIGDVIGGVGSTGHSSGDHLHFEVRGLGLGGSSGQAIDPLLVLRNAE